MSTAIARQDSSLVVALGERAKDYIRHSRAESTHKAYRFDWAHFSAWCDSCGRSSMPASPETVVLYLTSLADQGMRPSTIQRRVASISVAHQGQKHESPTRSELVASTLQGIRRMLGIAPKRKTPIRVQNLHAAFRKIDDSNLGTRDRALILVGYIGGFRRSELVGLDVEDVSFEEAGAVILLRRSKTDQEGQGQTKAIPYSGRVETCPVRALQNWIGRLGDEPGPLFRRVRRGDVIGKDRLSSQAVALVVKRWSFALGLKAEDLGGHSLRSGFVTDGFEAGCSSVEIMRQTGHRSEKVLWSYCREANKFKLNAATKVGL